MSSSEASGRTVAPSVESRADQLPGMIDSWLGGRRWIILTTLLLVAAVSRMAVFWQVQQGPLGVMHRWSESDMSHFDSWARQIVAGDWLSAAVPLPLHGWHLLVAEKRFALVPAEWEELAAELQAAGRPVTAAALARQLWEQWCGRGRLYQDPLYPYLVAVTYCLAGPTPAVVLAWQLLLGLAGIVLVHAVTRRAFGELAAGTAAFLTAFNGPLVFYENMLLRDSLIGFAGLAIVWLVGRAIDRPTTSRWLWAGLGNGIALLLKVHLLLFIVGVIVCQLWLTRATGRRQIAAWVGPFVIGLAVGVSPLIVRSIVLGQSPFPSGGLPAFAAAAGPAVTGASCDFEAGSQMLAAANYQPVQTLWLAWHAHPDIASRCRLVWRKWAALCHRFEMPNNANFLVGQRAAPALRLFWIHFGIVSPLAITGLLLGFRRLLGCWPLYWLVLTNLAVILLTIPLARYRIPYVLAVTPFAGLAVAELTRWVLTGRWWPATGGLAAVLALAVWTNGLRPDDAGRLRAVDYTVTIEHFFGPRISAAESKGDWTAKARLLGELIQLQPGEILTWGRHRPPPDEAAVEVALVFADVYEQLAQTLKGLGEDEAAASAWAQTQKLRQAAAAAIPREAIHATKIGTS